MLLTYRTNAEGFLRVTDWGQRSRREVEWVRGEVQHVEYWDILWVNAYVRNFPANRRLHREDPGWVHWAFYPVRDWWYIRYVFDEYFGTAGLYERVSFQVETWTWSNSGAWEIDDQV